MKLNILIISISVLIVGCTQPESPALTPTQLRCEYMVNPSVIDVKQPRLGWINIAESGLRGQSQSAWQVRVASAKDLLEQPDLWNSEKVISNQSNRVVYDGKPLSSRQDCWWQVRVWNQDGVASDWSAPAYWHMGMLETSDWKAEWIGAPWQGEAPLPKPPGGPDARPTELPPPAPLLRKEFSVDKKVSKAIAYVTGLGYFELYLNGAKVGDDVLVPNQTNYGKRPELIEQNIPLEDNFREYKVMYMAYDVTDHINNGTNCIGAILGNGFYNAPKYWVQSYGSPRFIGQVHITYTDGSEDVIVSDQSWKADRSAILMDLVYHGEHYDARLEQPGWNTAGFDDADWEPVAIREAPYGALVAHTAPTDKIRKRLSPVSVEQTEDGSHYVDFGVEISGWLQLNNVDAPAGHKIDIEYISNTYSGDNSYIFRGDGPESYSARFNWFVFSAVKISNWPGELEPEHLAALAVNTDVETSAVFETSNQLFNDINEIWQRSQLDNMHGGIASDCPHRERAPYTGDGQVACVTVMHNFDSRAFYHKWIQDILGAQNLETGYVPNGAPWEPGCGGGVAWGAAMNIMPWEFYLHYGALDMLEDNYEGMKAYIQYMQTWVDDDGIMYSQRTGKDGKVLRWFNLGEWSAPGETVPDEMVHTFYFWRCSDLTSKSAAILGEDQDAEHYAALAERTRQAFMKKYYDGEKGSYGSGGGNIFALRMGVPEHRYDRVIAALKADIAANDGHLDTGIFGTQFFFEILSEHGMHDLAYTAMTKRERPSYGYWLSKGGTTTRESWGDGGSHNHPMFGGGIVWFYRKLAGMQADPEQPGYRHIIFRPQPIEDLSYTTYTNETPYGNAGITWNNEGDHFSMEITVPVGSTATVYVPALSAEEVMESDVEAAKSKGVNFDKMEDGYAIYQIGSGEYNFKTK